MKPKNISLFEEAMEGIQERFVKNRVNKSILSYLYSLPRGNIGKTERIRQVVLSEYSIPIYDNPTILFSEVFKKSLERLERDGMIEKNCIGYCLTPTGENIAELLKKIEAYAVFIQEVKIEQDLIIHKL